MDECDRQTELARDVVDERENGNDEQRVRLLLSLVIVVTERLPYRETAARASLVLPGCDQ
jgi:hypothetical protein